MTIDDVLQYQLADRMPLFYLWRAVWRLFYDERSCSIHHESEIQKEILKWNSVVQYHKKIKFEKYGPQETDRLPIGSKGDFIDEIEFQIGRMCQVLVYHKTNQWNGESSERPFAKESVRIHNLDYRKIPMCIQVFPESISASANKKAQGALEQNMKDYPELYKRWEDK